MQIGKFTKKGDKFTGKIETLTFTANVTLYPVTDKQKPEVPDFRAYAGAGEVGAGWIKTHENCGEFISLKLDDPSFQNPVNCALFKNTDNETYRLVWDRS